jgi:hypothetical protein
MMECVVENVENGKVQMGSGRAFGGVWDDHLTLYFSKKG